MSGLFMGACLPNLKFVSLAILELLPFNVQKVTGHMTGATFNTKKLTLVIIKNSCFQMLTLNRKPKCALFITNLRAGKFCFSCSCAVSTTMLNKTSYNFTGHPVHTLCVTPLSSRNCYTQTSIATMHQK